MCQVGRSPYTSVDGGDNQGTLCTRKLYTGRGYAIVGLRATHAGEVRPFLGRGAGHSHRDIVDHNGIAVHGPLARGACGRKRHGVASCQRSVHQWELDAH